LIHLYLWDQDYVTYAGPNSIPSLCQKPLVSRGCTEPGFVGWDDGGPTASPASPYSTGSPVGQWYALTAFVSAAKAKGIWVVLHFAIDRVTAEMSKRRASGRSVCGDGGQLDGAGNLSRGQYATWVNAFVSALESYQNVLVWGIDYGIQV